MEHRDIIEHIWSRQGGEYAFYATRLNGRWKDHPTHTEFPERYEFPEDADIYFTPLTFIDMHRSNDTAAGIRCLFADLDPVDPEIVSIRHSMAWETSPGSYQGLWLLHDEMGYSQFANLNRRLTILTGADPGGWMGSKLLRWPGTMNHKYSPSRPGKLLWWDPEAQYSASYFDEVMPVIPNRPNEGAGDCPDHIPASKADQYIADRWQSLPLRARSMLMQERVPDRSLHIVRTIHELLKSGVATHTVFNMLWWRPWNKWRTDRHNPSQLWAEINRAKMHLID